MAITIKGIRLESIAVKFKGDESDQGVTSEYSLISSADKVLATQSCGGYGRKVLLSASTEDLLGKFTSAYKADIERLLGLDAET